MLQKLSIITSTLNSEKYIMETLISIKQIIELNIVEVEHIVVDAGSKDKTIEIIERLGISKVYSLPKSTMYEAIDYGFKLSNGDWLCWLNSDDLLCSKNFDKLVSEMKNAENMILTGDTIYIDGFGNKMYRYNYAISNYSFLKSFNNLLISQPSTIWRKSVYTELGGVDLSFRLFADRHFFMRAIERFGLKRIAYPLSKFRVHGHNLSIKYANEGGEEDKRINEELKVGTVNWVNRILNIIGHTYLKIHNIEMILWKVRYNKINIFEK